MNKKYTIWTIITLLFLGIGVFMYKNFNKTPEEIKVEHSLGTGTFLDTTHNSKFSKKETKFILSGNYELSNYERCREEIIFEEKEIKEVLLKGCAYADKNYEYKTIDKKIEDKNDVYIEPKPGTKVKVRKENLTGEKIETYIQSIIYRDFPTSFEIKGVANVYATGAKVEKIGSGFKIIPQNKTFRLGFYLPKNYIGRLFNRNYKSPYLDEDYKKFIILKFHLAPKYKNVSLKYKDFLISSVDINNIILNQIGLGKVLVNKRYYLDFSKNGKLKNYKLFKVNAVVNKNTEDCKKYHSKKLFVDCMNGDLENDIQQFGFKGKDLRKFLEAENCKVGPFRKREIVEEEKNINFSGNKLYFEPKTTGDYYVYVKDENDACYLFQVKSEEDIKANFAYVPEDLSLKFYSPYPILTGEYEKNIKKIFLNVKTTYYDNNKSLKTYYFIQPGKVYSGTIVFPTILGDVKKQISVKIDDIPEKYKLKQINANKLNIISANKVDDHILVNFKNVSEFTIYFQTCKQKNKFDFTEKKGTNIDLYAMDCNGEIEKVVYKQKDFQYWNKYQAFIKIPENIKKSPYFRVSLNDFKTSNYFKNTDIGVFVKTEQDNKHHIYLNNFSTGKPVEEAYLEFYNINEDGSLEKLGKQVVMGGETIFKPKYIVGNPLLIKVKQGNDTTFSIIPQKNTWFYIEKNGNYKDFRIGTYIDGRSINQKYAWGGEKLIKIYGYTDRGLYKPGDKVFFAGWVKNLKNYNEVLSGEVEVSLKNYQDEIGKVKITKLDGFGGFKGSFQLPKTAKLGNYRVNFKYGNITYNQDIKVDEFQKPTFFVETKLTNIDDTIYSKVSPKYYFGENLKDYNLEGSWEMQGKDTCWYCWWWNEKDYYYNWTFESSISTGGEFSYQHLKSDVNLKLFNLKSLKNLGYKTTIKLILNIKDNNTDETQTKTDYLTLQPKVKIGFAGQMVEYFDKDNKSDIKGVLDLSPDLKRTSPDLKLVYTIYKRSFDYETEKGVDGNYYYVNSMKFKQIASGDLQIAKEFVIPFPYEKQGEYFIKAELLLNDVVLGGVQKRIYFYDYSSYYYNGDQKNNFVLDVNIPKKDFALGEKIPVNINPYIKDSYVILTVERGNEILDTYRFVLTGGKIQIPVKENYFPNVNVSVIQFKGKAGKLNGVIPAKEPESSDLKNKNMEIPDQARNDKHMDNPQISYPRFYIGYADASINGDFKKLNIDAKITKLDGTSPKYFKPGEKIKIVIKTTDYKNNPIKARLSIAIVDKSLADLYDLIKKPMEYFYNKLGSSIYNSTNWKNLYLALKVFTSNGAKGGGGGEADLSIRKKFYDLAFWRGGVFTENGEITLTTTLPDNTTTWMLDIVGITKDVKLGTKREYFQTKKDVQIQANLPSFVTIEDDLKLPVWVKSNLNVSLQAFVGFDTKNMKQIKNIELKANEKTYLDIYVPKIAFDKNYLYLKIIAKGKNDSDAVELKIPVRKKGFILHKFYFSNDKKGAKTFNFEDVVAKANLNIGLSKFPIQAFEKAFKYLVHYPYACTEQLASGLYPILLAKKLDNENISLGKIIKNNKVLINGEYKEIKSIVEETIEKIFSHQKQDGGLGYWEDENEKSNEVLSAYIYGLLLEAQQQGYKVQKQKLARLTAYLDKIGNNAVPYLYYQYVSSLYGKKVNLAITEQLYNKNSKNLAVQVLTYAIYVNSGKEKNIEIDFNQDYKIKDWYWNFLDKDILKAIKARTDLKLGKNVKDEVLYFLNSRNSNGVWGWSTQKNVQILLFLGDYIKSIQKKGKTSCKLLINGKAQNVEMEKFMEVNNSFENLKEISTSWDCDDNVLVEEKVDYVLKDLGKIKTELHNLTGVNWTWSGGNKIGDVVEFEGSFKVLKKAEQLAVEFYIPSNYKFIKKFDVDTRNDAYNEVMEEVVDDSRGGCRWRLKHYEIRFDRLFLYFDELPKGTECKYKIKAIKAFEGKTNIMPVNIFEMYDTEVWGRKIVR